MRNTKRARQEGARADTSFPFITCLKFHLLIVRHATNAYLGTLLLNLEFTHAQNLQNWVTGIIGSSKIHLRPKWLNGGKSIKIRRLILH
ncbi:MAG: hypothetical protein ACFNLE_04195, partial [Rothia aeria]